MTSIDNSNPLKSMLDNAFSKFDRNKDGALDSEEFQSFNEVLKPGVALDGNGKPTVDYSTKMDQNSDGEITEQEMDGTSVLMPANLTDGGLQSMLHFLIGQDTPGASAAASIIAGTDNSNTGAV